MKLSRKSIFSLFILVIIFFASFGIARAYLIDPSNKTARLSSDTANQVNFRPSITDNGNPVYAELGSTEFIGYAWGNTIGWVNLNSLNCDSNGDNLTDTGSYSFCSTGQAVSNFKVSYNAGDGKLSGYAWSQNGGWINFGPFANSATSQVVVSAAGELNGFAWIQNYGWLEFACPGASCVKLQIAGGSGGGGSPPLDGSCGSSDSQTFSSIPTSGLCNGGSATSVSGSGPWTWQCTGSYGGSTASCQANFSSIAPPPLTCTPPKVLDNNICVDFCDLASNANDPQCTLPPPEFCDLNPNAPGCNILPPPPSGCTPPKVLDNNICVDFCDLASNANDPQCTLPPPEFCEQNPDAPGCNIVPPPQCVDNPTLPECNIIPPPPCIGPNCGPVGPADGGPVGPGGGPVGPGGFVKGVLGGILPPKVIDQITNTINQPAVGTATKVVATAGLVAGAAVSLATALFVSPLAAPELVMIPFRLWTLLLSFLGIRKQVKKWGVIYNSVTMQPLDPVYVVLKNLQGNEIATSLTDIDGRYGFPVEPGTYRIMANKTDYQFPSVKLAGREHDTLHKDLYFGGDIVIKEAGEVITKNIPMDQLNFNWNEWAKNQKGLMKFYSKRNKLIAEISSFLFGVGFTVATVALIFAPVGYNIAIFGLYVLLFILRHTNILKAKKTGSISDQQGNPLSFAIIRVSPAAIPDVEITHRVADKFGRFYCLVPNGNYIVKIDEKTGEETYSTVFTSAPIKVTKGLIDSDLRINR